MDYDRTPYYINIHILLAVASSFDEKIESEGEWHRERERVIERGRKRVRVKETERGERERVEEKRK